MTKKTRFYTHGVEAVPYRHSDDPTRWQVRPCHPDGEGYAPISHLIHKDLAQQWAVIANLSRNDWELIAAGLALLEGERAEQLEAWASAQGWEPVEGVSA